MTLRLVYSATRGELDKAIRDLYLPVATAATQAVEEAAAEVKTQARADIARAGFSKRWQNALRVDVYPRGSKVSINAAAHIYHKIPYAGIFEEGGTIRGKPKLWLPLPTAPKRIRREKVTPARFIADVGPLISINRPGQRPLLAARAALSRAQAKKDRPKVSMRALRRGAAGTVTPGRTVMRTVPLFIGLSSVLLPKKLNIYRIIERAAGGLADRFTTKIRKEAA